ncbi:MAG TPA: hypothetical protein VMJ93_06170 [Verrucomicrobiae bacterium]|nr:hypothetical protein [Verrucomicrobiae bacterium]
MSYLQLFPSRWNWKASAVLACGALFAGAVPASAHHLEKHFKVGPQPVVTINNPNGKIVVRAWTKSEVMVVADHYSDKAEVDAELSGNRVDLITHPLSEAASPDDLRADFEISVPEDAELQIHNDAGEVNVMNVLGDMTVETVAAGVDLEDAAGYLTVKTVAGSFQCVRCAGRVEANSITGSFRFLDLRSYHVRAQTSRGDIFFSGEFLPNGDYMLKNYSGTIEVRFKPGDSFDLSATSVKGKVNNEAKLTPPDHQQHYVPRFGDALFGTFNAAGRARVELSSFDGTINILKRD